jgi:hypothetical protein
MAVAVKPMANDRMAGSAKLLNACTIMLALSCVGCGSDLGGGFQVDTVTAYEAASAFSPTGHHVEELADGRYRITATGSAATPKSRVEKIAIARAAEFGIESNQKFFQTSVPQISIRCGKREYLEKGEKRRLPARGYSVVEVDVVYANTATDPSFRPVRDASRALQTELQTEVITPEAKTEAARNVNAQCGV